MEKNYSNMTAMVLYKLEQVLGTYIVKRTPDNLENSTIKHVADEIERREREKRPNTKFNSTVELIAATYLDDLFKLVLQLTESTPENKLFIQLKQLCSALSIFEIRNAVAHPNKIFLDCYWYRIAAIANDPLIQQLELNEVKSSFNAASEGRMEVIPEDWLSPPEWFIPNNLPQTSDHDITSLIGRPTETKQLETYLLNPRVGCIAVVAPGGIGKTALAIDVLEKASKKIEFNEHFEAIIFVSLKLEVLTAKGIVKLDAPETIDELRIKLLEIIPEVLNEEECKNFDDLIEAFKEKRLLLFIDNLETLLRDNPEAFDPFQFSLPPAWRLLVTSRVSVNAATCLTLGTLSESHAKHFIRLYATRRNATDLVKDELVERILGPTRKNTLAMRLAVDAYILGSTLQHAADHAASDVINFSYTNLLEVIGKESIAILECLFIQDAQSRIEISENLDFSIDEVAKGLHELTRTSLISRDSSKEQETYGLYASIRDLLLVSPRNQLIRENVQKRVLKRNEQEVTREKKQTGLSIYHQEYVPNDLPQILKDAIYQTNEICRKLRRNNDKPNNLLKHIEKLRRFKSEYPNFCITFKSLAKIYALLGDNNAAKIELEAALKITPNDFQTTVLLGRVEQSLGDYEHAFERFKSIKEQYSFENEEIDSFTIREVAIHYFINQLYSGGYDGIIEDTHKWEEHPTLKDLLGANRARAWKRKFESITFSDEKTKALVKSIHILEKIIKEFGCPEWARGGINEIVEEFVGLLETNEITITSQIHSCIVFIEKYIFEIYKDNVVVLELASRLRKLSKVQDNPFRKSTWGKFLESEGGHTYVKDDAKTTLSELGYITTTIYHLPKDNQTMRFTRDDSGSEYLVHHKVVENYSWQDWIRLKIGDQISVIPEEVSHAGKTQKATKARTAYVI